jgi:hypothetical protein
MDDVIAMDPVDATQPTVAMEPVNGTEPCAHCGAPLARDQRYCLECGTPRTYLSGMLLERLRAPAEQAQPGTPGHVAQAPPNGVAPYGTAASSSAWSRNNVLTLIAGIGVLLLAMGVGVLIGRSGGASAAATPAPQVITVGGEEPAHEERRRQLRAEVEEPAGCRRRLDEHSSRARAPP